MSDYSDEDFEMSGGFNPSGGYKSTATAAVKVPAKNDSPFKAKAKAGFALPTDKDDGYAPRGQVASNREDYEDDDFDEDEEDEL